MIYLTIYDYIIIMINYLYVIMFMQILFWIKLIWMLFKYLTIYLVARQLIIIPNKLLVSTSSSKIYLFFFFAKLLSILAIGQNIYHEWAAKSILPNWSPNIINYFYRYILISMYLKNIKITYNLKWTKYVLTFLCMKATK